MSKHADDLERGYFLPEDGQHRLKKLRGHMEFLSQLAQPRTADEEPEWMPEIRTGELAVCLELLAEQAALVLDEVTWPARREARRERRSANAGAEPADGLVRDDAAADAGLLEDEASSGTEADAASDMDAPPVFGLTIDQVDELTRLLDLIGAHGDVVFNAEEAGLAVGTLSSVGHAIFDDARAAKDIVERLERQRLDSALPPSTGVREQRVGYH